MLRKKKQTLFSCKKLVTTRPWPREPLNFYFPKIGPFVFLSLHHSSLTFYAVVVVEPQSCGINKQVWAKQPRIILTFLKNTSTGPYFSVLINCMSGPFMGRPINLIRSGLTKSFDLPAPKRINIKSSLGIIIGNLLRINLFQSLGVFPIAK